MACGSDFFLGILAVLFPPLPGKSIPALNADHIRISNADNLIHVVWVKRGLCSADSLINIALCVLGFFPGLLHSWYIILKYPDAYNDYTSVPHGGDAEGGTITYYYVSHRPSAEGVCQQFQQSADPAPSSQQNYGTTAPSSSAPHRREGDQSGVAGRPGTKSGSAAQTVPPSYEQAIKGDHKIQSVE